MSFSLESLHVHRKASSPKLLGGGLPEPWPRMWCTNSDDAYLGHGFREDVAGLWFPVCVSGDTDFVN